jgi:hypothetical protein
MNPIQVQIIRRPNNSFFKACVDSLQHEPIDLVVSDYGSHLDTRLKFIEGATAPYVFLMDDDDEVVPGIFAKLLTALELSPDAIGAYSYEEFIDAAGNTTGAAPHFNRKFDPKYAASTYHFPRAWILKTDAAQAAASFIRTNKVSDYIYPEATVAVLAGLCGEWVEVDEIGYRYRQHAGGLSATMPHQWYRVASTNLIVGARDLIEATAADTGYIGRQGELMRLDEAEELTKTGYV